MSIGTADRIVVTGGAGFLGSHVVEVLAERGYRDVVIVRRRDYDLAAETDVERLYRDLRPAAVVHLAGEVGGIGANLASPGRFFHSNLAMGLHLIEHARRNNVRKFVQVGTICAYPKFTPVPFREDDLWNGYPEETNAPYGIAKKALLVMCQAYRRQYGLNAVYLLPVNLYGPRDNFDPASSHVIPALIRKCVEAVERGEDRIVCWGSGRASREFLYVADCAEALVLAMEKYDSPDPLNVGTGCEITIRELTERIARLAGFAGEIAWDAGKPDGQPRRQLDVSRIRKVLGWQARTEFEEGLRRTVEWYRANR